MKQGYTLVEYGIYREIKNKETGEDLSTTTWPTNSTNLEAVKLDCELNGRPAYESNKYSAKAERVIKKVTIVTYEEI